jgi:hypothetical protein
MAIVAILFGAIAAVTATAETMTWTRGGSPPGRVLGANKDNCRVELHVATKDATGPVMVTFYNRRKLPVRINGVTVKAITTPEVTYTMPSFDIGANGQITLRATGAFNSTPALSGSTLEMRVTSCVSLPEPMCYK